MLITLRDLISKLSDLYPVETLTPVAHGSLNTTHYGEAGGGVKIGNKEKLRNVKTI